MTTSEDRALARENDAIARMVGQKLRGGRDPLDATRPAAGGMPETLPELVALIESTIEKYPRETVVAAAVIAFGVGTLWRRGYF
jgi:hypothetical protein